MATVEVRSLMLRGEWEAERRHRSRIEDMLNHRLRPTTHFIDFEIRQWDRAAALAAHARGVRP